MIEYGLGGSELEHMGNSMFSMDINKYEYVIWSVLQMDTNTDTSRKHTIGYYFDVF